MTAPFPPLGGGLREAWKEPAPAERLRRLRRAAVATRAQLIDGGPVLSCSTHQLVTFPYPTKYAFNGGGLSPAPFVMMTNRMQIVQFEHEGRRKTLLFNPTDLEGGRAATFYADLQSTFGDFISRKVIPSYFGTVEQHLARVGLTAADVDYLAFDHLHVQELRRLCEEALTEGKDGADASEIKMVQSGPNAFFEGIDTSEALLEQIDGSEFAPTKLDSGGRDCVHHRDSLRFVPLGRTLN